MGTKDDLVALCRESCKTQQPSTPERTGSYPIIPTVHGSGHWWHGMASVATSPWPSSAVADISPNFLRTLPARIQGVPGLQPANGLFIIHKSQKPMASWLL